MCRWNLATRLKWRSPMAHILPYVSTLILHTSEVPELITTDRKCYKMTCIRNCQTGSITVRRRSYDRAMRHRSMKNSTKAGTATNSKHQQGYLAQQHQTKSCGLTCHYETRLHSSKEHQ